MKPTDIATIVMSTTVRGESPAIVGDLAPTRRNRPIEPALRHLAGPGDRSPLRRHP